MAVRLRRWLAIIGIVVVVAVVGLSGYVAMTWDRVYDPPMPEVRTSTDPAVLARGEYLVYGPAHCVECHGALDDSLQKLAEGQKVPLAGGLALAMGPLGTIYAANLTPDQETGIGRYSDGQIARMMRWSVKANGRSSVEPLMPFGDMSDDDLRGDHFVSSSSAAGEKADARQRVDSDGQGREGHLVGVQAQKCGASPGRSSCADGDERAWRVPGALRLQLRGMSHPARTR
jgi:mono/diheme cytochrome c family protein